MTRRQALYSQFLQFVFNNRLIIGFFGITQTLQICIAGKNISRTWIGDSHASFTSQSRITQVLIRQPTDALIWLGPKLMYSISKNGFPSWLLRSLRFQGFRRAPLIFSFGEIDVRAHLVAKIKEGQNLDFVSSYVKRIVDLGQINKGFLLIIMGPVPPTDVGNSDTRYPRNGTLAERIQASQLLNSRVEYECDKFGIKFLDTASVVANGDGSLRSEFTDDGCHLNHSGAIAVKGLLDEYLSKVDQ